MKNTDKKQKRLRQRQEQKAFAKKVVRRSAVAAVILIIVIFALVNVVPSMLEKSIDRALDSRDFDRAMRYAAFMGAEKETSVSMRVGYLSAEDLLAAGSYEEAKAAFRELGSYEDAAAKVSECDYRAARNLMESGDYESAARAFAALNGYGDSGELADECRFRLAQMSYESGDLYGAYQKFSALDDERANDWIVRIAKEVTGETDTGLALASVNAVFEEEQTKAALTAARATLKEGWIDVGYRHTVARTQDGRALAAGDNSCGQCDVGQWTDITKICAGAYFTVGLKSDGTVVAVGRNADGECKVDKWTDIVDIAAGAFDTYALTADGSVLHTGSRKDDVSGWKKMTSICAGAYAAAGIDGSGNMQTTGIDCLLTADAPLIIADVSTGYGAGITQSGKALATFGPLDWDGAVTLSCSGTGVIGIDNEGRVLTHFFRESDNLKYDFSAVTQKALAVAAGGGHHAVLLDDGSVTVIGGSTYGQADTASWKLF